jgi:molybdopterin-guanine dinucleotide biosynthesis protein A
MYNLRGQKISTIMKGIILAGGSGTRLSINIGDE